MRTLTPYEIWYGRNTPPPEQVKLKSSNLNLIYQAGDLRYICFRGVEVIRRIYVGIRDQNWNTIQGSISDLVIHSEENRFSISFKSIHQSGNLDYTWQARIAGDADGKVTYTMDGNANTSFRFCRIGFCILHPIHECTGRPYRAETRAGLVTGTLPILIEPQRMEGNYEAPLFPACSSFTIGLKNNASIHTTFEGDLFEVEDQRNWTDGSFKTYCTPLSLGYPHHATAGRSFHQEVTLWLEEQESPTQTPEPGLTEMDKTIHLSPGDHSPLHLPEIGFGLPTQPLTASPRSTELLTQLKPAHLKFEVHMKDPAWVMLLESAIRTASQLDAKLALSVFLQDNAENQLGALESRLAGAPVAWFIILHEKDAHLRTTLAKWMVIARTHLRDSFPGIPIYGGTNGNFAELNRDWPDMTVVDGISYPINSQVHSSDESSLIEALQGQADTATTARHISNGNPVCVSSVTMKPPFNQAANEEELPPPPGELPSPVDPRQMSLFCAAWTLGSIRALTIGGAAAVTYYETLGWRGLIETAMSSVKPEKFLSQPGMVFPVYHVFADLANVGAAMCTPLESNQPLAVTGIIIKSGTRNLYLLANLTPTLQEVILVSLPQGKASIRRLNDQTAISAMYDPTAFRTSTESLLLEKPVLLLSLQPYEYIRLDIQ
jgi:hypothetical protein